MAEGNLVVQRIINIMHARFKDMWLASENESSHTVKQTNSAKNNLPGVGITMMNIIAPSLLVKIEN